MAKLREDFEHPSEYREEEHLDCEQGDPAHECRCFISPPCSACVGCPALDDDAWEDEK